ncbi:hypothetical protein CEE34_06325 [Candidatus Aerophobetes bacterium Ae_b3a]|nr:MAG: hypothetical protein CEE34_06325 [Candidatus Aerophobetes bacterium Ae_b3a]
MSFNVMQVGVGAMGRNWLSAIESLPGVEMVGLVDVNKDRLKEQAKKNSLGEEICFTSIDNALAAVRCDAIINVTPPRFHKEIDLKAFQKGISVLSEKPLSDNYDDAVRIVEAAKRNKCIFMVSQNYRFKRQARTIRKLIEQGHYGRPEAVIINFFKGHPFTGFRTKMPYPLIVDMAIHHFDMIRYFLDLNPSSIFGKSWNPSWSWYEGDAACSLIIEMEKGVVVSYCASFASKRQETSWNADWRIECPKGVIIFRNDRIYVGSNSQKLEEICPVEMDWEGQGFALLELMNCAKEGRLPETNGRDNLISLRMVFKSIESFETGKKVYF